MLGTEMLIACTLAPTSCLAGVGYWAYCTLQVISQTRLRPWAFCPRRDQDVSTFLRQSQDRNQVHIHADYYAVDEQCVTHGPTVRLCIYC